MKSYVYGTAGAIVLMLLVALGISHSQVDGLTKDRDRWRKSADDYSAAAAGWEKNFRWAEQLRGQERDGAVNATKAARLTCDSRVDAARKTSSAIQSITTRETIHDQAHCPVRRGVGFERLLDATGLAAVD